MPRKYFGNEFDKTVIEACKTEPTMAKACAKLGLYFSTFKRNAVRLKVYEPNQAGKGITRKTARTAIPLQEIIDGKHSYYKTHYLKLRLYKDGIKKNECEVCGLNEWQGKIIQCHLDHIDGNRFNHCLENLRIICPNCHSQTDSFAGKNAVKAYY